MMIKVNEILEKISNTADSVIAFCAKNKIWVFILVLWGIAVIFTTESESTGWRIFLPVFGFLCGVFLPALLFVFFKNFLKQQFPTILFNIIWGLTFVGYPSILLATNTHIWFNDLGVFDFHEAIYNNDDVIFYLIFYVALLFFLIEIFLYLREYWTMKWTFFKRLQQLTLEQTLLILLSFFAIFIGFIELVAQEQTPNSFVGIPIFIVKMAFLSIQLFLIMLVYYSFYWVNHYVLINKVLRDKGVIPYVASFMFFVLICYPIAAEITYQISTIRYWGMQPIIKEGSFHGVNFLFPFMEMLISIPFILAIQWSKQGSEIATLEKEKSTAELNLLKQQINPHFFFNTLNNLYALSLKKDEATPEVILQLSELMRYVIYKGRETNVLLKEEVKYIEDYCELQQIRLYKNLDFQFNKNIEDENLLIPPLLFIILIENAFKHGIEPAEKECFLHINLESKTDSLTFICENSIEEDSEDTIHGIGLENLKRRLNLRFPNQYKLEISETATTYKVELQVMK